MEISAALRLIENETVRDFLALNSDPPLSSRKKPKVSSSSSGAVGKVQKPTEIVEPAPATNSTTTSDTFKWINEFLRNKVNARNISRYPHPKMFLENGIVPTVGSTAKKMRQLVHVWLWDDKRVSKFYDQKLPKFAEWLGSCPTEATSLFAKTFLTSMSRQMLDICATLETAQSEIQFEEKQHVYAIKGKRADSTVTKSLEELCGSFDANLVAGKLLNSYTWKKNKHFEKCNYDEMGNELTTAQKAERLKLQWEMDRNLGTQLHKFIESQYETDAEQSVQIDGANKRAYFYFEMTRLCNDWLPLMFEMRVFDAAANLAGSIDGVYVPNAIYPRQVIIVDWKRKKLTTTVNGQCFDHPLMAKYARGSYWRDCMQVNMYRELIEQNYNLQVIEMYLVAFPPNEPNFELYGIPKMIEAKIFLNELRRRRASPPCEQTQPTIFPST